MNPDVEDVLEATSTLEGGGFPVRRPFPVPGCHEVDPFLLLDELGPVTWKPGEAIGAPAHPHRGFETVTYLLEGHMEHRDSRGHSGELKAGDVQWMTAGSGIVHSELPHPEFKARGGQMHGFQIWVNLPRSHKMMEPRYQEISAAELPVATSEDGGARVVVLAGESMGVDASIDTITPITLLHLRLEPGARFEQQIPPKQRGMLYLFKGRARAGSSAKGQAVSVGPGNYVVFAGEGPSVELQAAENEVAECLILGGEPLDEPMARQGPFVMNTAAEVRQAFIDYQFGDMGTL
jgi:hypothetical protein